MKRILLIDDDRETADLLAAYVAERTSTGSGVLQLQQASAPEAALHKIKAWKPHVALLAADSRAFTAADLVTQIRAASPEDYSAIVLLHAQCDAPAVARALEAGADDHLARPLAAAELTLRLRVMTHLKEIQDSLRRATHRMDEMANTDEVTGLLNMRALYRKGDEELTWAARFRKPVSAILVNLDGLSTINRDQGFLFGTFVIQEAARRIRGCLRSIDFGARVGADEFFVLLKETDLSGAEFVAERIREAIQSEPFRNERTACKITACLGVGGFLPDQSPHKMGDLLHIVSEALGSAKQAGPDRVEVYSFG